MSHKRLKVVVVDDHAEFRGLVKAVVETADWQCIECRDGSEALEQYAQSQPDLVLMDISMGHLDGIRTTAQIKARFPAARVLILTQYDDGDLRAAADRAGACGYILKQNLVDLSTEIQTHSRGAATETINVGSPTVT